MIDLGDPVVLTFTVTDTSGNPANASSATITVTLPDQTTSSPTVTNPSTGTYTATYITTQAGHHKVSCVATGTNASSQSDVFEVAALDPGLIISLNDARKGIGQPAAGAKDEDLRTLIYAAAPIMEDLIGAITPTTYDEWYDGGSGNIRVAHSPIISVSAVVEHYGNTSFTLTSQPLNGGTFSAYGYTVDLARGIFTRREMGLEGCFAPGTNNVHLTYLAGRRTLQGNHLLAARRLVRHLWQTEQQGFRPDMGSAEGMALTPSGFAVPRTVVELCAPGSMRTPGIA